MKNTKFYTCHKKLNAKLVDFAGYAMPVQYESIIAEHKAVRGSVGVFDVSHMGEVIVKGENALAFVQHITTNNAAKLFPGRVQYSAMCYEDGGIVDDLLVYMIDEKTYMLVINASNIEKDVDWMNKNNSHGVELINESDEYSLLAVQGPDSQKVVEKVFGITLDIEYYHFTNSRFRETDVLLSRTGYTGEHGYELYCKCDEHTAIALWDAIFEAGAEFGIQPAGLGARDTLRLEKGFCLYGNDIDKTTNPLEAGLGWITKLKKGEFIGREALLNIKEKGVARTLVPMITEEKAIPRHGYEVTADGRKIGTVTSGTMSPVMNKGIALGYLDLPYNEEGTEINFVIRKKEIPAKVTKLPFV